MGAETECLDCLVPWVWEGLAYVFIVTFVIPTHAFIHSLSGLDDKGEKMSLYWWRATTGVITGVVAWVLVIAVIWGLAVLSGGNPIHGSLTGIVVGIFGVGYLVLVLLGSLIHEGWFYQPQPYVSSIKTWVKDPNGPDSRWGDPFFGFWSERGRWI